MAEVADVAEEMLYFSLHSSVEAALVAAEAVASAVSAEGEAVPPAAGEQAAAGDYINCRNCPFMRAVSF